MAIRWLMNAWRDLPSETIVKCFQKCGFQPPIATVSSDEEDELDKEFLELYAEFTGASSDANEFIDFDQNVPTCEEPVNIYSISWREELHKKCIASIIPANESISIDENDDDDNDDDDSQITNPPSPKRALELLDEVMLFFDNHKELQPSVQRLITAVEKIQIKTSRQSDIRNFFG